MILTGTEIYNQLGHNLNIVPFRKEKLNPNSYNITLHNELVCYDNSQLDCRRDNLHHTVPLHVTGYTLRPGKLYLGRTVETFTLMEHVAFVEGRSSLARLGLFIHSAGLVDTGFAGHITLEFSVIQPLKIYPYIEVGQICYHTTQGDKTDYNGKYQNNEGTQVSKLFEELN